MELTDTVVDRAQPQLWTGNVLQDPHFAADRLRGGTDELDRLGMLLGGPVREVEAGHVHARRDHALEHFWRPRRRADGRHDLRRSHETHSCEELVTKTPLLAKVGSGPLLTNKLTRAYFRQRVVRDAKSAGQTPGKRLTCEASTGSW